MWPFKKKYTPAQIQKEIERFKKYKVIFVMRDGGTVVKETMAETSVCAVENAIGEARRLVEGLNEGGTAKRVYKLDTFVSAIAEEVV